MGGVLSIYCKYMICFSEEDSVLLSTLGMKVLQNN